MTQMMASRQPHLAMTTAPRPANATAVATVRRRRRRSTVIVSSSADAADAAAAAASGDGGRHPDYYARARDGRPPAVAPRPELERDNRYYRRTDASLELAAAARRAFAEAVAAGEAAAPLARAALLAAAEDDAIASSSTVPFPVDAYLMRIERLAGDIAWSLEAAAAAAAAAAESSGSSSGGGVGGGDGSSSSSGAPPPFPALRARPPHEVVAAVEAAFFALLQARARRRPPQQQQHEADAEADASWPTPPAWCRHVPAARASALFSAPAHGRSALPRNALLDHPGTHERPCNLNDVLVKRQGPPAALAIVFAEVVRQLQRLGAVDFPVGYDLRGFEEPPRAAPLGPRRTSTSVSRTSGSSGSRGGSGGGSSSQQQQQQMLLLSGLNALPTDALAELQRLNKRAYWPFAWDTSGPDACAAGGDGSHGGFRGAAKAALRPEGEVSAALRAVAATAAHRLERGVFTSPGAGDLRRCAAAAERLVMLAGAAARPAERRDLGVLQLHAGRPAEAAAELDAYLMAVRRGGGEAAGAAAAADPFDVRLALELRAAIAASGVAPAPRVMSVEAVLAAAAQGEGDAEGWRYALPGGDPDPLRPLTW